MLRLVISDEQGCSELSHFVDGDSCYASLYWAADAVSSDAVSSGPVDRHARRHSRQEDNEPHARGTGGGLHPRAWRYSRCLGLSDRCASGRFSSSGDRRPRASGGPLENGQFTLAEASADLLGELDRLGVEKAHFCGLSLGAMIAFRIAVDRPERVHSLTLAAGQVKPPRLLMTLQRAIMRMLPARVVAPQGVSKAYMLAVVDAVAAVDLTGELASVAAPTLVLCGSRDRANLPAARRLASGIPEAELHIIDGAGHQSNVQAPERFSAIFYEFLRRRA